jgi:hypothetical protein
VSLLMPLLGLAGQGAAAVIMVRLVSVGSLPPAMLGFLEEGVRREMGAAVRMGKPSPASLL